MKRLPALLLAVIAMAGIFARTSVAAAPATYRLDLFHTGGKGIEIFAVERLRLEPLPWPGHPGHSADDGQSGLYRYEVKDAAGRVLRAQGYASVAGEWLTTAEAATSHRTFTESLRFPAPAVAGPVHVRIFKRDAAQAFQLLWETKVDPADMFVDRTPAPEQALVASRRTWRTGRQGRPAADRRRLYGGRMCGEIRSRCAAHVDGPVP